MDYVGKPSADQNYANARTYFEEKMSQLDHVRRLLKNTTGGRDSELPCPPRSARSSGIS